MVAPLEMAFQALDDRLVSIVPQLRNIWVLRIADAVLLEVRSPHVKGDMHHICRPMLQPLLHLFADGFDGREELPYVLVRGLYRRLLNGSPTLALLFTGSGVARPGAYRHF